MSYFQTIMTKDEFKQRRERIGMTQGHLADLLEMSTSTISKYEIGVNEVPKYFEFIFEALEARQIKKLQAPISEKVSV